MKIVFLDIDGVLNNRYTEENFEGFVFVSDEKILLLKEILDATGAELVLSSSWREGWIRKESDVSAVGAEVWLFEALQEKLGEYGIELLDHTGESGHRGEEISAWLECFGTKKIDAYVVLDDRDEELQEHSAHLVQTDLEDGLNERCVKRTIGLLNG